MPQFRLTDRMALELKIETRGMPNKCDQPYDDWYVDIIRIQRKKVYIFMHVATRMAIAVIGQDIGGLANLFNAFPILLRDRLLAVDKLKYATKAYDIADFFTVPFSQFSFTKTDNKSLIRYVADFSFILEYRADEQKHLINRDFDQGICEHVMKYWLTNLVKDPNNLKNYTRPQELVLNLL
jgi:hypothetical protein